MATGAGIQQAGQAGEDYVAAELCRRGAYAVTFSGNIPNFDILASNREQTRAIQIQVKTKRTKGVWQASTTQGRPRRNPRDEDKVLGVKWICPNHWESYQTFILSLSTGYKRTYINSIQLS